MLAEIHLKYLNINFALIGKRAILLFSNSEQALSLEPHTGGIVQLGPLVLTQW